jgi:hypothetical protein
VIDPPAIAPIGLMVPPPTIAANHDDDNFLVSSDSYNQQSTLLGSGWGNHLMMVLVRPLMNKRNN